MWVDGWYGDSCMSCQPGAISFSTRASVGRQTQGNPSVRGGCWSIKVQLDERRGSVCPHEPRTLLGHLLDPTEMCDFVQRYTRTFDPSPGSVFLVVVLGQLDLHSLNVARNGGGLHSAWDALHTYRVIDFGYNLSNYYFAQSSIPIGIVMIKQIFQFWRFSGLRSLVSHHQLPGITPRLWWLVGYWAEISWTTDDEAISQDDYILLHKTRTGWERGMQDSEGESDYVWGRSSNNSEGLQIKICMIYWFGTIWSRLRLVELNLQPNPVFNLAEDIFVEIESIGEWVYFAAGD